MSDCETNSAFRIVTITPLVTVGRYLADPRHPQFACSGPARWTSFVFPRRAVRIVRSSGERIVATPNVAMFYNTGDEYRREAIDPAGDHDDFFVLHPTFLVPILEGALGRGRVDPSTPFRFTHLAADQWSYLEQRRLIRYLERETAPNKLLVEESVARLLEHLIEPVRAKAGSARPRRVATAARRRTLVDRTKEYLATHFRDNLTLADLARAVDSSVGHIARLFRAETGRSLHQYRLELRLRAALDPLSDPATDLTALALDLGFSSHSHFSWAFRSEFGLTPSQFRSSGAARPVTRQGRAFA